eukprot:3540006-Prymnesium_polylepis.1
MLGGDVSPAAQEAVRSTARGLATFHGPQHRMWAPCSQAHQSVHAPPARAARLRATWQRTSHPGLPPSSGSRRATAVWERLPARSRARGTRSPKGVLPCLVTPPARGT